MTCTTTRVLVGTQDDPEGALYRGIASKELEQLRQENVQLRSDLAISHQHTNTQLERAEAAEQEAAAIDSERHAWQVGCEVAAGTILELLDELERVQDVAWCEHDRVRMLIKWSIGYEVEIRDLTATCHDLHSQLYHLTHPPIVIPEPPQRHEPTPYGQAVTTFSRGHTRLAERARCSQAGSATRSSGGCTEGDATGG